jgi:hypothetical protein
MIEIDAPTERLRSSGSIEDFAADPTVKFVKAATLAQDGERAALADTAVTPRVDRASSWITLDVAMESPHAYGTWSVADGQRLFLQNGQNGRRKITMLVPTIVSSQLDLQRIFECKKEQARLARERAKS